MSQIETLNYCAHAIEDIKEFSGKLNGRMPYSEKAFLRIIELLREAQKFILPNCCDIFDPSEFQQPHLDLFRLPFPVCAFEAPWQMEHNNLSAVDDSLVTLQSTKRISLCIELNVDKPEILFSSYNESFAKRFPQGGVYVVPIYWTISGWEVLMGGMFVPYQNQMSRITSDDIKQHEIAFKTMVETGRLDKQFSKLQAEPFVVLPEVFQIRANQVGVSVTTEQILLDSHDEVTCAVQACAVLNCENINTETIEPIEKLNKKRIKNDKEPFFTYHVLQINEKKTSGAAGGGSHRSPRSHLRRGHIRRLENKTVWVRSAMINANSKDGSVAKEYKIG